jgi:predicted HicB family RNase H-like nuclease
MEKKDVKTNIIFPEDMWEEAKIQAAKERISLGELVRQALKDRLAKKESQKKGSVRPTKGKGG